MADGGNGRWLGQNQSENDLCSIQADDWSVKKRKKRKKKTKTTRVQERNDHGPHVQHLS